MSFATVTADIPANGVNCALQAILATHCRHEAVTPAQFPIATLMELKELSRTVAASAGVKLLALVVISALLVPST